MSKREDAKPIEQTRGVFMISVAAELAEMHPQTLRMYEARGLIEPKRSPKGTRLYSQRDVDMLRRIQEMTTELGKVRDRADQLEQRMAAEVERVRRAQRAEIVPYGAYETEGIPPADPDAVKIPIERTKRGG